jgi:hypothetical protein
MVTSLMLLAISREIIADNPVLCNVILWSQMMRVWTRDWLVLTVPMYRDQKVPVPLLHGNE